MEIKAENIKIYKDPNPSAPERMNYIIKDEGIFEPVIFIDGKLFVGFKLIKDYNSLEI